MQVIIAHFFNMQVVPVMYMSVRNDVLNKLENNVGRYFSGEELAAELNVTRASIWKAVNKLKEEGYIIDGIQNKGYSLLEKPDIITAAGIRAYLDEKYRGYPISIVKETASTSQDAKQEAAKMAVHGSIYIAEKQTAGRGRRGRSFLSLGGSSIYMSVILRPAIHASKAVMITTAASVAVCRAIRRIAFKEAVIKWVNDIYLDGKKICGILTEAVTDCESGTVDSIVLGIGINFNVPKHEIPEELNGIVGAIYDGNADITRNQLAAEVLNNVFDMIGMLPDNSYIDEYRKYSMILGCEIVVIGSGKAEEAEAVDIDDEGGLIVKYADGEVKTLNSGEITIRKR